MTENAGVIIALLGLIAAVAANFAASMKWSGRIEQKVDGLALEMSRQRDGQHDLRNLVNIVLGKVQILEQRMEAQHDRLTVIEQRCESRAHDLCPPSGTGPHRGMRP